GRSPEVWRDGLGRDAVQRLPRHASSLREDPVLSSAAGDAVCTSECERILPSVPEPLKRDLRHVLLFDESEGRAAVEWECEEDRRHEVRGWGGIDRGTDCSAGVYWVV